MGAGRGVGTAKGCPHRTHNVRSRALSTPQDRHRLPPGTTASTARPGSLPAGPTYGPASRSPGRRNCAPASPAEVASEEGMEGGAMGRGGIADGGTDVGRGDEDGRDARPGREEEAGSRSMLTPGRGVAGSGGSGVAGVEGAPEDPGSWALPAPGRELADSGALPAVGAEPEAG